MKKRVVLDRCCPVPKQRGLPSGIFLFAGFRLVCVRGFLSFSTEGTRRAEALCTIPRTGFSGTPLLSLTRCAVGRSHTRCRIRPELKALNVLPQGWGHGGTGACSAGVHARVCFTRQGHEDDSLAIFSVQAELSRRRRATRESLLAIRFARRLLIPNESRGPHEMLGLLDPLVLLRGWLHYSLGARSHEVHHQVPWAGSVAPRKVHHQVPWAIRRVWLLAFLNIVGIDSFDNKRAPGRIAVEGRWPWRTTDVYAGSASGCPERCCPRVSGGTPGQHVHGATCFSVASVVKVSFNLSPHLVDVPPPGEPGSRSLALYGASEIWGCFVYTPGRGRPRQSQRVLVEEHHAELALCAPAQRHGGCLDDAEGAELVLFSTCAPRWRLGPPRTSCNSRPEECSEVSQAGQSPVHSRGR